MNKYNFFTLASELSKHTPEEVGTYVDSFFIPENYHSYEIPEYAEDNERKAIEILFTGEEDILTRLERAREYDYLCVEAFFVEVSMFDDILSYDSFYRYYLLIDDFPEFTIYGQENYLLILDLFVEYLIDIGNIKTGIRVQKDLIRISKGKSVRNTARLCYMYFLLEDADTYYDYYLSEEFDDPGCYLLLIVTLLKNNEEGKAKEVLHDMFSLFPKSRYIDRIYELDEGDEEARRFIDCVNGCFDELCSVPYFFKWCAQNKEDILDA